MQDAAGNTMLPFSFSFDYIVIEPAELGDIIITEFLPDPTPSVGLPESEFIELLNTSAKYINLENFTISDNTANEGILPAFTLNPNTRIILCPAAAASAYQNFGEVIVPSAWPALNNGGDSIVLKSASGLVFDSLAYNTLWYQNEDKETGGYSLEIINTGLSCFDQANWTATIAAIGGTPGTINSVANPQFTGAAPTVREISVIDPNQLKVTFSKRMDATSIVNAAYRINSELIAEIVLYDNQATSVKLTLPSPLQNGETYTVEIAEVKDCNGNLSQNLNAQFIYDELPPKITEVVPLADTLLYVVFDEVLLESTAKNSGNYVLNLTDTVKSVQIFDSATVILTLRQALEDRLNK